MPALHVPRSPAVTTIAEPTKTTGVDAVSENVFAIVALLVASIAFLAALLQVLHQYLASAVGFRKCHHSVMGKWAEGTRRKFRWKEFRMEVIFETPVLFTASPSNDRGPIPKPREIYKIDGQLQSYTDTRVLVPEKQKQALDDSANNIHTADDEKASWVTLLSTLQSAEQYSREWEAAQLPTHDATNTDDNATNTPPDYELVVCLQRKIRSWDFIPAAITKPYASSTVCHLVELMALLGLYWEEFELDKWILRAEGNGFILSSNLMQGLGGMVVFEATGTWKFDAKRVIPCMAVKHLSFGAVPWIFDDKKETDHNTETELNFGPKQVFGTLEALGCDSQTTSLYEQHHKHIFSVAFEVIGMLGKVFRVRRSSLRMLPNPTTDTWSKNPRSKKASWKAMSLMSAFWAELREHKSDTSHEHIKAVLDAATNIVEMHREDVRLQLPPCVEESCKDSSCGHERELILKTREVIHDALERETVFLERVGQDDVLNVVAYHIGYVVMQISEERLSLTVTPDKERILMEHYFNSVKWFVIGGYDDRSHCTMTEESKHRNAIWISLVFRMLCWFLLHDFDEKDVMKVPAYLRGSRMPIYIG